MSTAPPPKMSPSERVRYKRSFRNYLLDSRFQLKYTGLLVFIALAVSGILGFSLERASARLVAESRKVSEVSRMNMEKLGYDDPELIQSFGSETTEHEKTMEAEQKKMMLSLVGGLGVLVIVVGLFGIYFTHKVAGPIFKMKRLLRDVGQGKLNFHGGLRKGDELQDFFEQFSLMVEGLKDRQRREIDLLEQGLSRAKESGADEGALEPIRAVRDEMRRALEQ